MKLNSRHYFIATLSFLIIASPASAGLVLTFDSSLLPAIPGQTVLFSGTLANTGATVFINGWSDTFPLPVDDSPFLAAPLSMTNGQVVSTQVLKVMVPVGTAPGLYSGTFDIVGGASSTAQSVIATTTFGVNVSNPVPEPSAFLLLGTGAAAIAVLRRRRLR